MNPSKYIKRATSNILYCNIQHTGCIFICISRTFNSTVIYLQTRMLFIFDGYLEFDHNE